MLESGPQILSDVVQALSLRDRVAVITGAASGLGKEAARLFTGAGAKVVLADVNAAGLEATAATLREAGGDVLVQPTDVTSREAIEHLAEAAVKTFGSLDVWINSAGIVTWSGIAETPQKEADKVVAVNMMGTFWGCAAAGRIMMQQGRGGAIVNVSSLAGSLPVPTLSVYAMTKAGVEQLTKVAAAEFGPAGIRVNAVAPGWIDTPINASSYSDEKGQVEMAKRAEVIEQMKAMSPLGMTGEPMDIGLALLYLASDASRFVTGHTLRVSGGA